MEEEKAVSIPREDGSEMMITSERHADSSVCETRAETVRTAVDV